MEKSRIDVSLAAGFVLGCLALYRRALSPVITAAFGPLAACRHVPSCSLYAAEAVRRHGARAGLAMAARRLLRCHPWGTEGWDPVP